MYIQYSMSSTQVADVELDFPQSHSMALTASSSPLRLGLPSASPKESSVGGSLAWDEDFDGELCRGAGVGAVQKQNYG